MIYFYGMYTENYDRDRNNHYDHHNDDYHGQGDGNHKAPRGGKSGNPVTDMIYDGTVVKIISHGAFVDFGFSQDGFVRIGEISFQHIDTVDSVLSVGQRVKVKFMGLDDRGRFKLSIKWASEDAEPQVPLERGAIYEGTVVKILDRVGAFVNFGPSKDGLVHISEISSDQHIEDIASVVHIGSKIKVRYLGTDRRGRYKLSIKQVETPEPLDADPEVGQIYDGLVVKLAPFGAFVDFRARRDGLVHISEISSRRIDSVESELSVGQSVRVKLLDIDDQGRARLSIRQAMAENEGDSWA